MVLSICCSCSLNYSWILEGHVQKIDILPLGKDTVNDSS